VNGPFVDKLFVEILDRVGKPLSRIRLLALEPQESEGLLLTSGKYMFYLSRVGGESWAVYSNNPLFGIPLSRLRGLEKAQILDVAHENGRAYFT
jgi:hypothetical protein